MKNKVIDYLTIDEVCDAIGIKRNSKAQITRWIQDGRITGAFKFSKSWAIPVNWVKSECLARGISWHGVTLSESEHGVSLKDYYTVNEYCNKFNQSFGTVHSQISRGIFDGDYVRFDKSYGIRKEDIK